MCHGTASKVASVSEQVAGCCWSKRPSGQEYAPKESILPFVWPTSHIGMLHPAADERARSRASDFIAFARASVESIPYDEAKGLLSCSTNQAETRKSLFEELGLLYVPYRSNRIVLTPLGEQLAELLATEDIDNLSATKAREATALLIWAQCRTQINRPQSRGVPRPDEKDWRSCDVKPYAAAWLAASDMGGKLYLHEFMGALRLIHQTTEFDAVVAAILEARSRSKILASNTAWKNRGPEMNYVIYWRSHISVAQQLMDWDEEEEAFVARPETWVIVDAALRFQSGCDGEKIAAIRSSNWTDADDYFMNVAGAACPPFLSSGTPQLKEFGGQPLADLKSYQSINSGANIRISGGPELCSLPLKMPCFHPTSPTRLLRIDRKNQAPDGSIQLELGLGRPIVNLSLLRKALGQSDDR